MLKLNVEGLLKTDEIILKKKKGQNVEQYLNRCTFFPKSTSNVSKANNKSKSRTL